MDWTLTMHGGLTDLMKSIAEEVVGGLSLVFFLPGQFDFARHVMEIKAPGDGVTMMNSWKRPPYDPYMPPKMDIIVLKDIATLNTLSERSPYIALLQDVTSDQPDDEAWVYFLARPQTKSDDEYEGEI